MPLQISEPNQRTEDTPSLKAVGIDLGTTHSLVAMSNGEETEIFHIDGAALVPSLVAVQGSQFVVGAKAKSLIESDPQMGVASVKRLMDPSQDETIILPSLTYIDPRPGELKRFKLGPHLTNPIQVSAEILRYLKEQTQKICGEPIDHAVITVPAYFSETARAATRLAAKIAGWKVLRLVSEPTAAALKFGLDQRRNGQFLVFDMGGGTFDVSILNLENGVFQVIGTGGDTHLGGDDVDHLIVEHLKTHHQLQTLSPHESQKLLKIAQLLKIGQILNKKDSLSSEIHQNEDGTLEAKISGTPFLFSLEEEALTTLIKPITKKIQEILEQTLHASHLSVADIDDVILVGGSTRLQGLHNLLKDFFGKPPLTNVHPDFVVAEGAALQAHALTHGSETLLLDVIPLSLGVETMGDIVEKIIPRNSPIPAQASQEFTTYQDNQTAMSIHVLQGEREMVSDCRSLARFALTGIPPLPAGFARIEVAFDVDADGLLTVSAQEKTTGIYQAIEVRPSHGLTSEEMQTMLLESFEKSEQDLQIRLHEQAWVKLQFTLGLCEKILTQTTGIKQTTLETLKNLMQTAQTLLKDETSTEVLHTHSKELEEAFNTIREN